MSFKILKNVIVLFILSFQAVQFFFKRRKQFFSPQNPSIKVICVLSEFGIQNYLDLFFRPFKCITLRRDNKFIFFHFNPRAIALSTFTRDSKPSTGMAAHLPVEGLRAALKWAYDGDPVVAANSWQEVVGTAMFLGCLDERPDSTPFSLRICFRNHHSVMNLSLISPNIFLDIQDVEPGV